jgi:hypothetical protein
VDRFLFRSSSVASDPVVVLRAVSWQAKREGTEFEGLSDHSAIEVDFSWELFEPLASVAAR